MFKRGDVVIVRKDFSHYGDYKIDTVLDMEQYAGKEFVIGEVKKGNIYKLHNIPMNEYEKGIGQWVWTDDMIQLADTLSPYQKWAKSLNQPIKHYTMEDVPF